MSANDKQRAAKGRRLAIILITAAISFLALQFVGLQLGWSNQIMGLIELAILAVFGWVMIQAYLLWRSRQS